MMASNSLFNYIINKTVLTLYLDLYDLTAYNTKVHVHTNDSPGTGCFASVSQNKQLHQSIINIKIFPEWKKNRDK